MSNPIPIVEIFGPTVQGEGLVIGQRTFFVRVGGCDYACAMCDSMHAVDPKQWKPNATKWDPQDLAGHVQDLMNATNCDWVTLSGGNPAMYNFEDFVLAMKTDHKGVSVETQGTHCPHWLKYCDYICCSPKAPGMGEKFEPEKFKAFYEELSGHPGFYIKVVIFSAQDLEFASMIAEMCPAIVRSDRFYLSLGNPFPPGKEKEANEAMLVFPGDLLEASIDRFKDLVDDLKEYPSLRSARILPQMHTWIWGNDQGH